MAESAPTRRDTSAEKADESDSTADVNPLPLAARRHSLVAEIRKRLMDRCGFTGGRLVLGVSGGADSLALLISTCAIRLQTKDSLPIEPFVVHVHHHLRESANADAAHVEQVCNAVDVPYQIEHVCVQPGENVSAGARRLRYDALCRIARKRNAAAVAVAHHAEDQLETMLMALSRGAGLDGLSGMAWHRSLDENISLVRPLLGARKADCESLCTAAEVTWREDPSNRDCSFRRARLRHEVVPILESLWPDAASRVAGTAELLHVASDLLEDRLNELFGNTSQHEWSRETLSDQPVALIAAGLRRAGLAADPDARETLSQRHLFPAAEAIVHSDNTPKTFELTRRISLNIRSKSITLSVNLD